MPPQVQQIDRLDLAERLTAILTDLGSGPVNPWAAGALADVIADLDEDKTRVVYGIFQAILVRNGYEKSGPYIAMRRIINRHKASSDEILKYVGKVRAGLEEGNRLVPNETADTLTGLILETLKDTPRNSSALYLELGQLKRRTADAKTYFKEAYDRAFNDKQRELALDAIVNVAGYSSTTTDEKIDALTKLFLLSKRRDLNRLSYAMSILYEDRRYKDVVGLYKAELEGRQQETEGGKAELGEIWSLAGSALYSMRDYPAALPFFLRSVEANQLAVSYKRLGKVFLQLNRQSEAKASLEKAIELYTEARDRVSEKDKEMREEYARELEEVQRLLTNGLEKGEGKP